MNSEEKLNIGVFCDASNVAYGVKLANIKNNDIKCPFILAKSCLSPLKASGLTIPRLQLLAAVPATRNELTIIKQTILNETI